MTQRGLSPFVLAAPTPSAGRVAAGLVVAARGTGCSCRCCGACACMGRRGGGGHVCAAAVFKGVPAAGEAHGARVGQVKLADFGYCVQLTEEQKRRNSLVAPSPSPGRPEPGPARSAKHMAARVKDKSQRQAPRLRVGSGLCVVSGWAQAPLSSPSRPGPLCCIRVTCRGSGWAQAPLSRSLSPKAAARGPLPARW